MWSMLGARAVDMLVWESFGQGWATDATKQLKLADCRVLTAPYGALPDLGAVRPEADVCFTWNGTTSGARVPDADWIAADRAGLTFCDATSAAFAQDLDWAKLDVTTFSWQKAMGGEGGHGVLILSPARRRAAGELRADRPLPKIFRLTKGGKLIEGIFAGETINTPSMLCRRRRASTRSTGWRGSAGSPRPAPGPTRTSRRCRPGSTGRRGSRTWSPIRRRGRTPRSASGSSIRRSRRATRRRSATSSSGWPSCSRPRASPTTSPATATRRRACGSGAAPRSRPPTSRR